MAGIGFELRKLLRKDSYFGLIRAYLYAGIISSGSWIISIIAMLLLGFLTITKGQVREEVAQFQTSVTYLIAFSLVLTGFVQLLFTRFVSDELFSQRKESVLPNFYGLLSIVTVFALLLSAMFFFSFFPKQDLTYKLLMVVGFVLLCNIWLGAVLLSSLKRYRTIVLVFFIGYSVMLGLGYLGQNHGLNAYLGSFVVGHFMLFFGIMFTIIEESPANKTFAFDFLDKEKVYLSLVGVGFFYNLGLWIDKFSFWFTPTTSDAIIGPLRASIIYDTPIFLAYLSIIPGMAVFLVRMETDFSEYYDKYFDAVLHGAPLSHITEMHNNMIISARQGIFEIARLQSIAVLITIVMGPTLLNFLGVSLLYTNLLNVDVVGTGLQIVFLSILNIFFYLDRRARALLLTAMFALTNFVFTGISINLGPFFFGYGFASSLLLCIVVGLYLLNKDLQRFQYTTFMPQDTAAIK